MFDILINSPVQMRKSLLIPVNNHSLDAVMQLINNCKDLVIEIQYATFNVSLWLNDFLVKNYSKIKYVSATPRFTLDYIKNDKPHSKIIDCDSITFNSDDELQKFFDDNDGKTLVIFTIGKYVDLKTLQVSYRMRYADITDKHEERDFKINKILQLD